MLELNLLWLLDNKSKTKIYVYPHMLFSLNLTLNDILANADLFRIYQLNEWIGYVNQNLYQNSYSLWKFTNLDNYFVKWVLKYFNNEYKNSESMNSVLKENFNNMTYDYIKKYFFIFVNDNKKISYYKDLIYMNLLQIYMSDKNSDSIFLETKEYFLELKKLSKNDYNEMVKILLYFKNKFQIDNITENIEKEIKFDDILWWVLWFKKLESNYMLYYIFNLYDLWKKDNFFNWIVSFSDDFLWYNWLKIKENKLLWYDDSKNSKLWYYISFLENIIRSHIVGDTYTDDINGIMEILNKYSLVSVNIYGNWKVPTKKTAIILHLNLLSELSEYVRSVFFEPDLEQWGLLVKNKKIKIDDETVSLLDRSYNNLFTFYTKNKIIFNEKITNDSINISEYEFIRINFTDYLLALKNYDKYKTEKDKLRDISIIDSPVLKIYYTVDDVSNYIWNFTWVDKNSIKVKTDSSAKIFSVNVNIWWKDFSLDLYPYDNNWLKNIYVDWVKTGGSYNLTLIKEQMDKQLKGSSNALDKNKNDFNNFFVNRFLGRPIPDTPEIPNIPDNPNPSKDPKDILVFKRDKLLPPYWEFTILKDFSQIWMNNIVVTNTDVNTDIKLKDVKFFYTFPEWNNKSNIYWAYLNSDYIIKDHYFNNIKLKIYKNITDWNRTVEQFGLWNDRYISIIWNLWILSLKDFLNNLLTYYNNIVYVNNILAEKVSNIEISINSSKKIKFTFVYNDNNYELSMLKASIINFSKNGKKILSTTFNYTDLPNRIDLLLK